ncbi:MAG: acyl-CoA dehydrogenase [Sphingomonadales bacterium 32-64-17]|nr:MAG: acyl-CoA dehydrogenase [Sphingomonadales bacterium 32-64-17]
MQFAFVEDQLAMIDAARVMLIETCTPADLRHLLERDEARDAARWDAIRDMGLVAMLSPEEVGGLGLSPIDFVGIAEAAGYVGLPEPLVEQAGIVVPLLAGLSDDRGWIERVLGGEVVAIGHPANPFVADADTASAFILAHGSELHLVERDQVSLTRQHSVDTFRRLFEVSWSPSAKTVVGSGWGQTADRGAVFAAAQLIGLGQRAIDLAVAYAKDRTQFGKPIGSYQAVKHLIASAQVRIEFARPVVHAAAAELPLDTLASRARVAHAKIAAGDAADLATRTAVQVFGAMGMTREADVHFFLKRTLALRYAWGTTFDHQATVVDRLKTLTTGPDMTFASRVSA